MSTTTVTAAHLAWYAERPEMLDAALTRIGPLRDLLAPAG